MTDTAFKKDHFWIPALFVLFFVLFVFIKVPIVIYLGNKSWTGLVTEQPYERGLRADELLAKQRAQDALGWHHRLHWQSDETVRQSGLLHVTMTDKAATPLQNLAITVEAVRPDKIVSQFSTTLAPVSDGYQAPLTFPLSGRWHIRLLVQAPDGAQYRVVETVVVR